MAVKSSFGNMVLCLGAITLVCSVLLGGIYVITEEPIARAADAKKQAAIAAVAPEFDKVETLQDESGTDYYVATDNQGETVAFIVKSSSTGFGGKLSVMVGFLPDGTIYDTSVLEQSETPGLGAKCVEETFKSQFRRFNPMEKVLRVAKDGGNVNAITASTITSRAYCEALKNAVDMFESVRPKEEPAAETEPADDVETNEVEDQINE